MKNSFVLLEADEQESEQDVSDNDSVGLNPGIPSEYNLPNANSSYRLDRLIQHLEEAAHLRSISKIASNNVLPTANSSLSAHDGGQASQPTASVPPTSIAQMSSSERQRAESMSPLAISRMSSRVRRPASDPPCIPSQTIAMAWSVQPTTNSTFSGGMEAPRATGLTVDEVSTTEGEQAGELEDVGLTSEHHSLEHWMDRYLGEGGLVAPGFRLFYVRCERQFEHKIVQPSNNSAFRLTSCFSLCPAWWYIPSSTVAARSMLPQNTVLASYLLTVPGLLYPKAPRVVFSADTSVQSIPAASAHPDLVLPIHSPIEDSASIERILRELSHLEDFSPHSWIKCRHGLYKDDVGLVVADDFEEIDYTVELCASHCNSPESCSHSEALQKRYTYLNQHWQNGLVFIRVKLSDLEYASDISDDIRYYFLASRHPAVQQSLLWMPPPSSWEFYAGEAVRFIDFDGSWCTSDTHYLFELPEGQIQGIVHYVGPSFCEINIPLQFSNLTFNSLHTMSKVHLEKVFYPGDTVLLLSGNDQFNVSAEVGAINTAGREGLVISTGPGRVQVFFQELHVENQVLDFHPNSLMKIERSASGHDALRYRPDDYLAAPIEPPTPQSAFSTRDTFTGQIPWKNLQVYPIKYSNKGYRAVVVDARSDENTVSGLSIRIRYEAQGMSNTFAWVDYDTLRRVDNNRFLHDDSGIHQAGLHTTWDRLWSLKPGYHPAYSADEQRLWERQRLAEENAITLAIADIAPLRGNANAELSHPTTPLSSSPSITIDPDLDPAWDPHSPDPPERHWILDPRIVEAFPSGLKMLVATSTNREQDRQVFFRTVDGIPGVYTTVKSSRKARKGVVIRVNPSTILNNPRSFSVSSNPSVARGLYMICSGEQTGVFCRRISYMMRLDSSKPLRWLVQSVKLIRKLGKSSQFDELLDVESAKFDRATITRKLNRNAE
ncbi:hypothetical protein EV361DRAFT_873908 [Lentinula raphanica]|nr:hypothetical protein EV361DRAFT_873908 [Lentinula raphanica]